MDQISRSNLLAMNDMRYVIWRPVSSGTSSDLRYLVFGNGVYLACALYGGLVLRSADGVSWSSHSTGAISCNGLFFLNGIFIFLGDNGKIITSTDGVVWVTRLSLGSGGFSAVIWTGAHYFAYAPIPARYYSSADGILWTFNSSVGFLPGRCATGAGLFVSIDTNYGYLYSSIDAISWTQRSTLIKALDVAWNGRVFVAVGGTQSTAQLATSGDGISWTSVGIPSSTGRLNCVVWTGTHFVAAGTSGLILTSSDGITWLPATSGVLSALYAAVSNQSSVLLCGSEGSLLVSP